MSILEQERAKGYREGLGQAAMIRHDEAHEDGRSMGWIDGYRAGRWRWFAGALVGYIAGWYS